MSRARSVNVIIGIVPKLEGRSRPFVGQDPTRYPPVRFEFDAEPGALIAPLGAGTFGGP